MAVSTIFGARVNRREDPRLVTGNGLYTADVVLPNMVHAAFLRSPYAHARIKSINTEKAKALPGVIAVVTGKDIASKLNPVPCAWQLTNAEIKVPKYYPVAIDKVRYVGDPVAVVVAETPYQAADALEAIEVEYELTVWITSQNPHVHRLLLSLMTGIPEHKIRVISQDVGGGFGSKIPCYGPEAVVVLLAKELLLPVKWIEDRRENYVSTIHGRDHVEYVELAGKFDGTITGIKVITYANLGAWLSTAAPGVPTILFGTMLSGPYKIKNLECEVFGVLTNTTAVDAYRGAGRPEATFILERIVDIFARKINMDPSEVRIKNFIPRDAFPYTTPTGLTYDSGDYEGTL